MSKNPLRFIERHYEEAVKFNVDGKLPAAVTQLCYAMEEVLRWARSVEARQDSPAVLEGVVPDAQCCPQCYKTAKEFQPLYVYSEEEKSWIWKDEGLFVCPDMHIWRYEKKDEKGE